MPRIGNSDQVLQLLRAQLQRAGKGAGTRKKDAAGRTGAVRDRPIDRVRQMVETGNASEQDVRQAIVRSLMEEQFGEAVVNDPAFISIAADVARIIESTEEGRALIQRAVAGLRVP